MESGFRDQVYENLNLKDTDELVQIWQKNDRVKWTELAFDVIREILSKRLEELPPQNEPIFTEEEPEEEDVWDHKSLEAIIAETEVQPVFYQPGKVLRLINWMDRAVIPLLVFIFVVGMTQLPKLVEYVFSHAHADSDAVLIPIVVAFVLDLLGIAFFSALVYFPFKALAFTLRILLEMEFNYREEDAASAEAPTAQGPLSSFL